MREILLTHGQVTLVDNEDFHKLNQYKWRVNTRRLNLYAIRRNGKMTSSRMHREILNAPLGMEIDHIDGNGLNNQRSNLRVVTHMQNMQNAKTHRDNVSGFKGLSWDRKACKWMVRIQLEKKYLFLGLFKYKWSAVKAYDRAALKFFGRYAKLNFPTMRQCSPSQA